MNQPKFKFGDEVAKNGFNFTVMKISFIPLNSDGTGEFKYNDSYWESGLELYQEPQKKKLYAYRIPNGEIKLFEKDADVKLMLVHYPSGDIKFVAVKELERAPEYDIEYPESK